MADILNKNQPFASPQEALAHYGVKGMKWGVVNDDDGTTSASGTRPVALTQAENRADPDGPDRRALVKKAALIAGGVALAGGVAYGVHKYGGKESSTSKSTKASPEKKTIQEPTSLIYLSRAKNKGLTFHSKGDTPDFFSVFDEMGLNGDVPNNHFSKDSVSGRIAARLLDPQGRRDFAHRPIAHDFVIPKNMADGIDSIDDVRSKIWPKVETSYQKFWDENTEIKYRNEEEAKHSADEDALVHHGVKGMKWGVRKDRSGGARAGGSAKAQSAGDKELAALDSFAAANKGLILEQAGVERNPNYERNRKLLIGAGVGLGIAAVAAGSYYAYSRQQGGSADQFTSQFHGGLKNQVTKKLPPLDTLDDNDLTLPSSTLFRRVAGSADEAISDSHMYVSHLDEDVDRYVGVFSKAVKARTGDAYLSDIRMRTSVSSPSLKKRVELMKSMLGEVDRDPKSLTEGMSFREVLIESTAAARAQALGGKSETYERSLGNLSDNDLVRETYGTFVNGMGGQINNPQYRVSHASSYLAKVRNMGYNALVDDANTGVLAKSPLILLTPQSSVKSKTSTKITDRDVSQARSRIKLFADDAALVRHSQSQKPRTPAEALAHCRKDD